MPPHIKQLIDLANYHYGAGCPESSADALRMAADCMRDIAVEIYATSKLDASDVRTAGAS